MDIQDRTILILGGSGLVGLAVARRLLEFQPARLILCALRQDEAEGAAEELRSEPARAPETSIEAVWGDIFLPAPYKDRTRAEVFQDPDARRIVIDSIYGELSDDVVRNSTLGALLLRLRPDLVVDCVNTATAIAYQNVSESAERLRREAGEGGGVDIQTVEAHLGTLHLPQLIRHVQIALEAMRRAGTSIYVKVGTAGTGGMGLNIPFTHSEERPSRALLSKAGVAGAHSLLLYLMARTPGGPAVKEIKPTAAISWKRIAYGEVRRGGRPVERSDATRALPLDQAFGADAVGAWTAAGGTLEGVFLDAGENGLFSMGEFEVLTSLGLMEYITPEEIAENVVREVRGHPTGKDIVAALDAATSGPTYRAGVLREAALERMAALEERHGVRAVAFEMLGPPRLSKLLFEAAILARLYPDLQAAAQLDPADTAERAAALIDEDADLRIRALSIGLPILLPDGARLLRGERVKVEPRPGQDVSDPRLADSGWIDLRPSNWSKWRARLARIVHESEVGPGAERGSRRDVEPGGRENQIRPGRLVAWVFRYEDAGARMKR